jgi:hypothetical protein
VPGRRLRGARVGLAAPLLMHTHRRPSHPSFDVKGQDRAGGWLVAVLRVLVAQPAYRPLGLRAVVDRASASVESDPPESGPVLVVLIDQQARNPGGHDVADSLKASVSLGLVVDGGVNNIIRNDKADGHEMRAAVSAYRCEPADRCRRDQPPHRLPVHVSTLAALKGGWREALAAAHQMP